VTVTPPLGPVEDGIVIASTGTCGRAIGGWGKLCGAPAKWHIIWDLDTENGLACDEHADEARSLWCPIQVHERGPDCAMPGSMWIEEERRCVTEGTEHGDLTSVVSKRTDT
jgi:hypothetical protein